MLSDYISAKAGETGAKSYESEEFCMNDLKVFNYGEKQVRTVLIEDEPWWVLADVCKVLDVKNSRDVAKRLDKDEVDQTDVIDRMGRKQKAYIVNESGLYSVILRSDKPEAKEFKRWITHDVLPAIRKTGTYTTPTIPLAPVGNSIIGPPPHYLPLALPRLPTEVQLQRADRLMKMAEHSVLTKAEHRQLLDLAFGDLTGGSIDYQAPPV